MSVNLTQSDRRHSATHNDVNAVHAVGCGERAHPVGYQGAPSHRQQRLGGPGQVSEPAASVGRHVPLEPGPVAGGKNHRFHLILGTGRNAGLLPGNSLL